MTPNSKDVNTTAATGPNCPTFANLEYSGEGKLGLRLLTQGKLLRTPGYNATETSESTTQARTISAGKAAIYRSE